MQFVTKSDFLSLIDESTLNILTDNNDALLIEAEGRAIEEMSAYLNVRYNTTKVFDRSNRNSLIVMYLCDIVLYHLHSRIAPDQIAKLREDRYINAKEWLEKTADGFTAPSLPEKEATEKIPLRSGNSLKKQDHYY